MLSSFGAPLNVAVAGSNGGIGQALHSALATAPNVAHAFALSRAAGNGPEDVYLDIEDEASIAAAAQNLAERVQAIDLVVVATGILHDGTDMQPEKALRMLDPAAPVRPCRIDLARCRAHRFWRRQSRRHSKRRDVAGRNRSRANKAGMRRQSRR